MQCSTVGLGQRWELGVVSEHGELLNS
jgi:hypothetical protein